jgi:hypothetical protein
LVVRRGRERIDAHLIEDPKADLKYFCPSVQHLYNIKALGLISNNASLWPLTQNGINGWTAVLDLTGYDRG